MTETPTTPAPHPRLDVLDIARGVAIIGVIVYHLFWDLAFLGFYPVNVETDLPWLVFARTVLGTFLFLAGVNLVLAHGRGVRWPAFWRRFGVLAAAAGIITVATLVMFPESFVFFGILHALALFSLLALPALRVPVWAVVAGGLVVIVAAFAFNDPAFSARPLAWIGFWPVPPVTNDLVPVFPWLGVTLLGVAVARGVLASPLMARLAAVRAERPLLRGLKLLGRWSLVIYLVHQPVLLGVLYPLSMLAQQAEEETLAQRADSFLSSCVMACDETNDGAPWCPTYCACGLAGVHNNDLWDAVESPAPDADALLVLEQITAQCRAQVEWEEGSE